MPLNIDFTQVLLHMLNFVILVGALGFLLYKPVNSFMTQRAAHYEALKKENEQTAAENERLRAEYDEKLAGAKAEIAEMRANAEKEAADSAAAYLAETKQKAADILASAEKDAERRRESILDSAQTEISELVLAATQKLLSDTGTPERDSALYDEFIKLAEGESVDTRKE